MSAENPLLDNGFRIPFDRIRAEHVESGIRIALDEAQAGVDSIASDTDPPTWTNTVERLDDIVDQLGRRVTPATHLVAVAETPELREAYNAVLPDISAFWSRLPLNRALWKRIKKFAATEEAGALAGIRRRHMDKTLKEFQRSGADLPDDRKARLQEIRVDLAQLQQKFSENVLDTTAAYELLISVARVPVRKRRERKDGS